MAQTRNALIERKKKLVSFLKTREMKERIEQLLGNEKKAEKFAATLINIALDSSLQRCTMESIVKAALTIAEAGLPISRTLGLAFIVPFKAEATPIISYKGWRYLLREEGVLLKAREVYDIDKFKREYRDFDESFLLIPSEHREENEAWQKKHLIGIWIAIKYTDIGEVENFFVPREKLDQLAAMSQARDSKYSPYNTGFWLEMYFAKAIGYIARKIGVSGEKIEKAFESENEQVELPTAQTEEEEGDIFDLEIENGGEKAESEKTEGEKK